MGLYDPCSTEDKATNHSSSLTWRLVTNISSARMSRLRLLHDSCVLHPIVGVPDGFPAAIVLHIMKHHPHGFHLKINPSPPRIQAHFCKSFFWQSRTFSDVPSLYSTISTARVVPTAHWI